MEEQKERVNRAPISVTIRLDYLEWLGEVAADYGLSKSRVLERMIERVMNMPEEDWIMYKFAQTAQERREK